LGGGLKTTPLATKIIKDKAFEMGLFKKPNFQSLYSKKDVKGLIKLLSHGDQSVVRISIDYLGSFRDPRAVEPLIPLLNHADKDTREKTVTALGKIGDPRAIEPLVTLFEKADNDLRDHIVLMSLGQLRDIRITGPLILTLKNSKDDIIRGAAVELLGEIKSPEAIKPLIKVLNDWAVRDKAIVALTKIGEPAIEELISALKNKNYEIRWGAVEVLWNLKDLRAVEHLAAILDDKDFQVREYAAFALADFKDPRSIHPIINLFGEAVDLSDVHIKLSEIGEPAIEPLMEYIKHKDIRKRQAAAIALARLKETRVIKPLIDMFKYKTKGADCSLIAYELSQMGKLAEELLIKSLKDKNSEIRYWSRFSLENHIGWAPSSMDERLSWHIAGKHYGKLVSFGKPAIGPLIKAVQDKNQAGSDINIARQALKQIIGEDLGNDPKIWLKWWEKNQGKYADSR
jgi:HEAT repeat protein